MLVVKPLRHMQVDFPTGVELKTGVELQGLYIVFFTDISKMVCGVGEGYSSNTHSVGESYDFPRSASVF